MSAQPRVSSERSNASFIVGTLSGAIAREHAYTRDSWRGMGFEWSERANEARKAVLGRAIRNLWVWSSQPGTGKTGFAVALAKEWTNFVGSDAHIVRMSQVGTMPFAERDKLTAQCSKVGLVVLDDFHRVRFRVDNTSDWIHSFIDGLYMRQVAIVVTANNSLKSVRTVAGEDYHAAFDRLHDGGLLEVFAAGESRRV